MELFDSRISEAVRLFSYPVWFVIKDEAVSCPCVDFTTGQPSGICTKCFGTGKKTTLKRAKAARQTNRIRIGGELMGTGETDSVNCYYTLQDVKAGEGDLILDGDALDVIQQRFSYRSDASRPVYHRYETAPKKTNAEKTKKEIRKAIVEAGYG